MRETISLVLLLIVMTANGQQRDTYSELHAKIQHVKEKYMGSRTSSDEAIAVVLHKCATTIKDT